MSATRPRVLILGGGFAGVGAAQKLAKADADVVLVDRHDYHTFQPMLYQLATGLLETTGVGHSLRDLTERRSGATVRQANATAIDLEAREVRFEAIDPMSYDYLVLALGAKVDFFGTEGAEEHAFPMYTLPDAVRLKEHILERWEAADRDPGIVDDGALNTVVVGGGPTGVETAGALAELYRADFAKGIGLEHGNRVGVGDDLTLPGYPEVYVLGDIAAIVDEKTQQVLPQLGSVALQSGEHAGESIERRLRGKDVKRFKYHDKGTMAAIGRRAAVVQMLGGRTMTGTKAQLAWATVHLALLPTNEDRAKTVVDWAGAAMTHQRVGRISVGDD